MLSKENTKEQVTDNQSRLIRMQKEDILPSSSQQILKLPEGFIVGKAVGGGDCFFDAVAQGLGQLRPGIEFTVKSLRQVCKKIASGNQQLKNLVIADTRDSCDPTVISADPSISEDRLWNNYLASIEYTVEDVERMKIENPGLYQSFISPRYGSTLKIPIWGRPYIEGRIICNCYNVKLHVIENLCYSGWSSYLIDDRESRSVGTNFNEKDTIHIINGGNSHFEPVLRKQVQQILPHSNLTQSEPSCVDISWTRESKKIASDVPFTSEIHREFISIVGNSDLTEYRKLEKLKDFFRVHKRLDVNFQVNQHDDTPLHVAVYNGELQIIKFLLKVGACIDIRNRRGKTPMDIAEDNDREDITQILQPFVFFKEVYVPGDGNCLFWSVALAYLTPVKFDDDIFCERFKKLFTNDHDVHAIQRLIQKGKADVYGDSTLIRLVTSVFRSEVIDAMHLDQKVFKGQINMEDFLESQSGSYFIIGTFKKNFECKFGNKKIKRCNIDTNKLQPNIFDKSTVKEISTELNKIEKCEIQEFLFETYLECMKMAGTWGGKHEINVISKLLESAIIVSQKDSKDYVLYNKEKKYCNKIYLSYEGWQHYQFYQVKHSNLIKFVLSFVQSFEMKLTIYDVLASMIRQENRVSFDGVDTNNFVLSIFGFSAYAGSRIMPDGRASLQIDHLIKVTKGFVSLSDLIETFNQYKLGFRKVLVDAGCDIFQSFEMQFEKIGFNYVSKVVDDITDKIIAYYVQKEHTRDLNRILIAEALVLDKYLQEMSGKIVQYGEKNYNLRDLYENIGVVERHEGSFIYYRKNNKDSKYGYRRSLIGEQLKEVYETKYTRVQTANLELENYVYAVDPQDFKDIMELVFYIVNKEIYIPNTKRLDGFIVKIKFHIEQEVSFLNKHILSCYQKSKRNLALEFSKDIKWLEKAKKNSNVISLMETYLKTIPNSFWCQQVKETFVSHAEVICQDYNNLFELQCNDKVESGNLWSCIKASSIKKLALMFKRMDFKSVCASVEEFTGRQEQINDIYRKLQEGSVVIVGPSGIGKTQLTRKFVEENKGVYLNVYEVNTQGMLSIESSFTSFVRDKLAISMKEDKERKKHLFLFQGAKKEDVEKILEIRGQRGGFDCLFTSSDQNYRNIAETALNSFKEEQATQFVKTVLNITDRSQDEQIKEFVSTLKGFPLAIKLAATCIKNKKFGISEYLLQYKDYDQTLPQSTGQNECNRVLQITLLISIKAMQEVDSRREVLEVLNAMAYFGPGQIDPGLFLDCGRDENELYSIFKLLEQYSIVHIEEEDDYKLYVMHELVKKAISSQFSIDEKEQVLSHAIKLVFGTEEDLYTRNVGHFLSLFYHSQGCESLAKESCDLACTIVSAFNMLCEYKKAFTFGSEALKVLAIIGEETVIARYEMAHTMIALGEYDLALQILWNLKERDDLSDVFPLLSLDKEIVLIYFKQKRYEDVFSYMGSDHFLLTKLPDKKNRCYLDNYLSIANTMAKIFVVQGRYCDAFTILYYGRELRDEIFLKRNDCDLYGNLYLYPSNMHEFYNLEARYIYALASFFISQDKKKVTINEGLLPHKEDLPCELSVQALFKQLQDILKNQESSKYLQSAPYSVKSNIGEELQKQAREKALQSFERVLQLQKNYGFLESHPKVLSVKFYIALLHSYLGDREKALQELQKLQELREKVIGVNHPDTLITVDAIQELFAKDEDRFTYLKDEIEKRKSLLQFEKSDLNVRSVSILKEMYAEKNSNDHASSSRELLPGLPGSKRRSLDTENIQAKRRKIDNQQKVSSYLDSVNVDLSHQQECCSQFIVY